ncbi:MAG: hypothetical protein ABL997_17500, partial [Planctomycetota bacterium]
MNAGLAAAAVAVCAPMLVAQDVSTAPPATASTTKAPLPPPVRIAGRLRAIRISTDDIFTPTESGDRVLPRLVNAVHITTDRDVVRREVFVNPGDWVEVSQAEELERNLRALSIFAEVRVELVPTSIEGEVDLVVRTRDRLTLLLGGGASYVGGVSGFNAVVGESNFLGLGDRLAGTFRDSSDGEFRGALSYNDLHVFDTWVRGNLRLSRTDEGDGVGIDVERPFKHLKDEHSWRAAAANDELAADYYRLGEEEGSVPYRRFAVDTGTSWASGPRYERTSTGGVLRLEQIDYGEANGAIAPELRVPGDTVKLFAGGVYRGQWVRSFREAASFDTLGFVQDIALSTQLEVALGGSIRDEDQRGTELQPELQLHAGTVLLPFDRALLGIAGDGSIRTANGSPAGWNLSARAQTLVEVAERHAFAGQVRFDAVYEEQDLEPELTLGADTGLRGYDSRLFFGTHRLLCNVEERWDTGLEVFVFRLGLCAFTDIGWISDSDALGRPYVGAGGGVRIGSAPLLGAPVLRIDLARALDDAEGNDDGFALAVTVGQAFTFGG